MAPRSIRKSRRIDQEALRASIVGTVVAGTLGSTLIHILASSDRTPWLRAFLLVAWMATCALWSVDLYERKSFRFRVWIAIQILIVAVVAYWTGKLVSESGPTRLSERVGTLSEFERQEVLGSAATCIVVISSQSTPSSTTRDEPTSTSTPTTANQVTTIPATTTTTTVDPNYGCVADVADALNRAGLSDIAAELGNSATGQDQSAAAATLQDVVEAINQAEKSQSARDAENTKDAEKQAGALFTPVLTQTIAGILVAMTAFLAGYLLKAWRARRDRAPHVDGPNAVVTLESPAADATLPLAPEMRRDSPLATPSSASEAQTSVPFVASAAVKKTDAPQSLAPFQEVTSSPFVYIYDFDLLALKAILRYRYERGTLVVESRSGTSWDSTDEPHRRRTVEAHLWGSSDSETLRLGLLACTRRPAEAEAISILTSDQLLRAHQWIGERGEFTIRGLLRYGI